MATATLYDFFELSGPPTVMAEYSYAGSPNPAALSFGPILEPVTVETARAGTVLVGDRVMLDGTAWTISRMHEITATVATVMPDGSTMYLYSSHQVLTVSDGTTRRYLAIEYDQFAKENEKYYPGGTIERLSIGTMDQSTYLTIAYFSGDNENRLKVAPAMCFATGTLIETADGPRPVEALRVGERVLTRDHGFQPLRWLGGRRLSGAELAQAPRLAPVRIAAGALGPGQPARELTLSPQHRVLVRSPIAGRMAGQAEVLVAAVHLLGLPGVERIAAPGGVGYWHLMFDAHEIVFANGAEAESLYLGPMARQALPPEALAEIAAIFPGLLEEGAATPAPARPMLRGAQSRRLVERQVKNRKPLVAPLPLERLTVRMPEPLPA